MILSYDEVLAYSSAPLVELTRRELYESSDLYDRQKAYISRMLDMTEPLGWTIWLDSGMPGIFLEIAEDRYSDILNIDSMGELANTVSMLELISAYLEVPERAGLTELQQRLDAVEASLRALTDARGYEHYLELFRAKAPEFTELGISLEIDELKRVAVYRNGNRPPITYEINQTGYYSALRALNNVRTTRSSG